MMRVTAVIPFRPDRGDIAEALAHIAAVPPAGRIAGLDAQAPVILLDNVFDQETCRRLIASYNLTTRPESFCGSCEP